MKLIKSFNGRLELDDDPLSCFARFGLEIDDGNLFILPSLRSVTRSGVSERFFKDDVDGLRRGTSDEEYRLECLGTGFTMSFKPQIKLLNTDGPFDVRFCFRSVFEFGRLMKFTARRKTKFGSQSGT